MNWKYHLLTAGCLLAAIAAYAAVPVVGAILLAAGILFEGIFWLRLLKRRPR